SQWLILTAARSELCIQAGFSSSFLSVWQMHIMFLGRFPHLPLVSGHGSDRFATWSPLLPLLFGARYLVALIQPLIAPSQKEPKVRNSAALAFALVLVACGNSKQDSAQADATGGERKGGETYGEYDVRRDSMNGSRGSFAGKGCTTDCS
ncbi:MAG: hypothetical protein RL367_2171, partial [Pseudomonadota bacterium]